MTRRPRPAITTTALPALATVLASLGVPGCDRAATLRPSPPAADGGAAASVVPEPVQYGGAPVAVSPQPPAPSPAPAAAPSPAMAPAMAPAPSGAAAAPRVATNAPLPGVRIVHNHPPGTPCLPITDAQLRETQRQAGVPR